MLRGLARLVAEAEFVLQAATSIPCPRINDLKVSIESVWFEIHCVELCAPRNTMLIIQHSEFFLLFFNFRNGDDSPSSFSWFAPALLKCISSQPCLCCTLFSEVFSQ